MLLSLIKRSTRLCNCVFWQRCQNRVQKSLSKQPNWTQKLELFIRQAKQAKNLAHPPRSLKQFAASRLFSMQAENYAVHSLSRSFNDLQHCNKICGRN
jgi:hypothetical protein